MIISSKHDEVIFLKNENDFVQIKVADRNNAKSVAGADTNAIWLTLIESAKANGIEPQNI